LVLPEKVFANHVWKAAMVLHRLLLKPNLLWWHPYGYVSAKATTVWMAVKPAALVQL
jgi:hypothetical protein